jgi:hypothetical protein
VEIQLRAPHGGCRKCAGSRPDQRGLLRGIGRCRRPRGGRCCPRDRHGGLGSGAGRPPGHRGPEADPGRRAHGGRGPFMLSFDSISVFARTVGVAVDVLRLAAGPYRSFPPGTPVVPSRPLRIGVVPGDHLEGLDGPGLRAWSGFHRPPRCHRYRLRGRPRALLAGWRAPLRRAVVAERWVAFGPFLSTHPEGGDPSVSSILAAARDLAARLRSGPGTPRPAGLRAGAGVRSGERPRRGDRRRGPDHR